MARSKDTNHIYIEPRLEVDSRCWRGDIPKHHGDFSAKKLIDGFLLSEIGNEDRTGGWIRPSGIGFCFRSMFYDKLDICGAENNRPTDRKLMGVGTVIHELYQGWMGEALGKDNKDLYVDELPIRYKAFQVSGRVDGVFKIYDWLWEIKTVSDKAFAKLTAPREKDLLQLHVYMWVLDIPRGVLHYINRNDGEDMEFRVNFDRKIWNKVERMLRQIQWHEKNNSVPPRLSSDYWCNTCKYNAHCMQDQEGMDAPEAAIG